MLLAGYRRVSRVGDRVETLASPEWQAEAIERGAKGFGYEYVMLAPELDVSGATNDRPVLNSAIERIESGELDGIAVAKLDRFSRSIVGAADLIKRIKAAGGRVISIAEGIDTATTNATQRKVLNDFLNAAEWERETRAEGFEMAKAGAIARGVCANPRVPFGYLKNEKTRELEIDPVVGPVIVRAFEMRAAGKSWTAIADFIAEALGRPFFGPTVSQMIKRRTYLGEARQGKHVNLSAHPPLLSQDLWEAAQLKMPTPPRGTHGAALLGGLVRCAGCSRRMSATFTKGHRQYRCRVHGAGGDCPEPATINGPLIEPLVTETVLSKIEGMTATASERTTRLEDANREVAEAEAEFDAYLETTKALGNPERFAAAALSRSEAVDEAKARRTQARLEAPEVPDPKSIRKLWPQLSVAERSQVLRRSFDVIWVKRGRGDDRIRLIATGHGPANLSVQGKTFVPVAAGWPDGDLPGEIRPARSQDVE